MNQQTMTTDKEQLVTFLLGGETFGIDIFKIREVIHYTKITSIPNTPEFVDGLIRLRDQVIPVVDMRKRLKINGTGTKSKRIIILELDTQLLGIVVDDVAQVFTLAHADYEALPDVVCNGYDNACITQIFKSEDNLIIVIEPELILSKSELQHIQNLEVPIG